MRLQSFINENGVNSLGRCCSDKQLPNGSCQGSCKTRFRICLKQYQAEIDTTSSCTFGAAATQILGDNTFNLTQLSTAARNQAQKGALINPIRFPFEFTWPVSNIFFPLHFNHFSPPFYALIPLNFIQKTHSNDLLCPTTRRMKKWTVKEGAGRKKMSA